MRRHILLCAAILTLAGCTEEPPMKILESPVPISGAKLSLVAFDSCDRLLTELRAATRRSVGPYGLAGSDTVPANASLAGNRADSAMAAAPAAPAFSGTNVHEIGADEPDIVKTDGRRIVTVDQGTLRVVDAATRTLTGRLELGRTGSAQLLLAGDHALVLSSGYPFGEGRAFRAPAGNAELTLVDLSGPPRIISRYQGTGRVVDARQTGTVARVVLSSPARIDFPSATPDSDDPLRANRQAVSAAPIDAWLPSWNVTTGTAVSSGRLDCGAVSRPASYSGAGMLSLLTFDLAAEALTDGNPVGVVSDGDIVYGTPTSLYVANDQEWRVSALPGSGEPDTEIFKFALPDGGKPVLAASGRVPGSLLNQYAMSEWDSRLRVATTTSSSTSSSAVRVLTDSGGKLVQTGVVEGLGKGERIYAVRFIGPRGYVVTFRQTDPLYSLDLSDPAAPRVTGELKITGYSAHLQQVGENLLVGVGQEASTAGVRQGLQVSLFDVGDPANPRRLAQHVVPQSLSNAEFDPHALLWWPATSLLVVPVKGAFEGALALRVEAGGLRDAGRISGFVDRSLVIGNDLWALGEYGMTAYNLSTLDQIATLRF